MPKILLITIGILSFFPEFALSQIVPDNTLGAESSVINSITELRSLIEGGATRGENLFHSFENFSIGEGLSVYFANPEGIANIFSRVTGSNISEILGTLGVEGNANLFFMNPNGIIFGKNATLDIGGSFIATTANSIDFSDGTSFDSRDENQKPLLTWNAPIGLGLDNNSGDIVVLGNGHNLEDSPEGQDFTPVTGRNPSAGLEAEPKNSFALIGGNIRLEGGLITAEEGQIELGSVKNGVVGLSLTEKGWLFDYQNTDNFGNIQLFNSSLIDTSGLGNGSIKISGRNISIQNSSLLLNQNSGTMPSQNIELNASESIELSDFSPSEAIRGGITVEALSSGASANIFLSAPKVTLNNARIANSTYGDGQGGNINISTQNLSLINAGTIGGITLGTGKGGNITVNASNSVNLTGVSPFTGIFSLMASNTTGFADGGDVKITTSQLNLEDGGTIGTVARPDANGIGGRTGKAGDVLINADDRVEISGISSFFTPSSIVSTSLPFGDSGSLTINTNTLKLQDGASLSVLATGEGDAGNLTLNVSERLDIDGGVITASSEVLDENLRSLLLLPPNATGFSGNVNIKTPRLNIDNGGNILVRNGGIGDAGDILIEADSIDIKEASSISAAAASGAGGNISITTQDLNISNDSQITAIAGGDRPGGNITIKTIDLSANNNNQITASAAQGEGGNITITAQDSLTLNNSNSIAAASGSGDGGNVNLTTDRLQIRDNSNISTSARGLGDGGNVTIKADSVLAINDSDITARAEQGNGGNITISADGVLGIEERPAEPNNGTSDADASSEFGADGNVEITNPIGDQYDPIIAMREPNTKAIGEGLRNQCWAEDFDRRSLSLVVVGGGGFPSSPYDFQDEIEYAPDPDFVPPEEEEKEDWVLPPAWQPGDPIINSNAIRITEDGQIYAVAVLTPQKAEELLCGGEKIGEEEEEEEK